MTHSPGIRNGGHHDAFRQAEPRHGRGLRRIRTDDHMEPVTVGQRRFVVLFEAVDLAEFLAAHPRPATDPRIGRQSCRARGQVTNRYWVLLLRRREGRWPSARRPGMACFAL